MVYVEGDAKVMGRFFLYFIVVTNFYLIKSCWIVLKLPGISDEIVAKNCGDFGQNRTIFIK